MESDTKSPEYWEEIIKRNKEYLLENVLDDVLDYQTIRALVSTIASNDLIREHYPTYVEESMKVLQDAEARLRGTADFCSCTQSPSKN